MVEYVADESGAPVTPECFYHCISGQRSGCDWGPVDGGECQCDCHRADELDDRRVDKVILQHTGGG